MRTYFCVNIYYKYHDVPCSKAKSFLYILCVQEVLAGSPYIVSYYMKRVKSSWTYHTYWIQIRYIICLWYRHFLLQKIPHQTHFNLISWIFGWIRMIFMMETARAGRFVTRNTTDISNGSVSVLRLRRQNKQKGSYKMTLSKKYISSFLISPNIRDIRF